MKFRKKPVEIEAIQWDATEKTLIALHEMTGKDFGYRESDKKLEIDTLEGRMYADYGDWVIRGVKGEVYPCKPDIFIMTYEKI